MNFATFPTLIAESKQKAVHSMVPKRISQPRHKLSWSISLALLSLCTTATIAKTPPTQNAEACIKVVFSGAVNAGDGFRRAIGSGLTFRLDPWEDNEGWEFEIGPTAKNPENPNEWDQYAYLLTPPYRFSSPRDINTGWGTMAQDAVKGGHEFRFALDRADAAKGAAAIEKVLWPDSDQAQAEAFKVLKSLAAGSGEFKVLDSKITPGTPVPGYSNCEDRQCGQIHWIKFEVVLVVPRSFKTDPSLRRDRAQCGPAFPNF